MGGWGGGDSLGPQREDESVRRAPATLKAPGLGQVAADGHVAPAPAVIFGEIDEEPAAVLAGADLEPAEIARGEKSPDGSGGRQQRLFQDRERLGPILTEGLADLAQFHELGGAPDPSIDDREIASLGAVAGFHRMEQA